MPPRPMERIAVIGAGNGGHAMAAHMTIKGVPVRFYEMPRFADNIRPARKRGGIEITGVVGEGFARPELITTDIAKAIKGVSHIFVVTQALGHEAVATLCAPYLEENQTIVLFPGSGGTLQLTKTFRDVGMTTYEWRYEKSWSEFAAVSSKGPASAKTRYISEDIPIGMVLLSSLGEMLNVPTPTARALIHISSVIHDKDYWQGGRTMEKLGLAGMTVEELQRYLLEGPAEAV